MGKRKKLEFKTKRHREKAKSKKIFLIFCIVLLIFAAISSLIMLNSVDYDLSNLFEGREKTTDVEETMPKTETIASLNSNFLAMCVSDDDENIRFISVINVNLNSDSKNEKYQIRVATLSPQMGATLGDNYLTFAEHFRQGGAEQTAKAIETVGNITIDRYACSTDTGFKDAIKCIDKEGKFTLPFAETINYRDEFNLFIPASDSKSFDSETLLNYFRYLGLASTYDGLLSQAEAISAMLDFYINKTNIENGEELFAQLYNNMQRANTNISGLDFNNSKTTINSLVTLGDNLTFSVEQNLTRFNKNTTSTNEEDTSS